MTVQALSTFSVQREGFDVTGSVTCAGFLVSGWPSPVGCGISLSMVGIKDKRMSPSGYAYKTWHITSTKALGTVRCLTSDNNYIAFSDCVLATAACSKSEK